ncbi:hypothetical protein VSDG_02753 [Cytospora chrysosperma]|uniref:DUF6546 domain-containing protein n=1 Tax=Cytospora chrysosperma TaxID=252740 RepID=A0A423WCL1_CYTCH|nr:hypothetical protein VSDG_02753 [Valsa sordida]
MSFKRYPDLPAELRSAVRQFAIDERRWPSKTEPTRMQGRPLRCAPLACVNREWQSDVERSLFSALYLYQCPACPGDETEDLQCLDAMVTPVRQPLVNFITLRMRVDETRHSVDWASSDTEYWNNAVRHALDRLFRTLNKWEWPESQWAVLGLHLVLETFLTKMTTGTPVVLADLPVVPVIVSFQVTAVECGFPFTLPSFLAMGGKLPGLTLLNVEKRGSYMATDECLKFLNEVPQEFPNLKHLDFSPWAHDSYDVYHQKHQDRVTEMNIASLGQLIRPVREFSYGLESLRVLNVVNLDYFFAPFNSENYRAASFTGPTWPRLRGLCLEGPFKLHERPQGRDTDDRERLGIAVGRAVGFMPELQYLEIQGFSYPSSRWEAEEVVFSLEQNSLDYCLSSFSGGSPVEGYKPSSKLLKIWTDSVWKARGHTLKVSFNHQPLSDILDGQGNLDG